MLGPVQARGYDQMTATDHHASLCLEHAHAPKPSGGLFIPSPRFDAMAGETKPCSKRRYDILAVLQLASTVSCVKPAELLVDVQSFCSDASSYARLCMQCEKMDRSGH